MRETERVENMCVWTLEHRLLGFEHYLKLTGKKAPTIKELLRDLYHARYLDRIEYPTVGSGANPVVYRLDSKGEKLLKNLGFEVFGVPPNNPSVYTTIPHTLGLADIRIAITQAVEQMGWRILQWVSEFEFSRDHDRVTLPGQRRSRALQPDGFFVVELPNNRISAMFIELDRATESTKTFTDKVKCYIQYHKSGQFTKKYGYKGFRVLGVVDDLARRRLKNLTKEVAKIPKIQRRFWFTHLNDIQAANPLIEPIWSIAGDSEGARLFEA